VCSQGAAFWKERIAKENMRLDSIEETRSHKGAHAYSMPGGPILHDEDVSRADTRSIAGLSDRSGGRSVARSVARSEVRSERGAPSEYRSSRYDDDGRSGARHASLPASLQGRPPPF
jgi:hypothetical protein